MAAGCSPGDEVLFANSRLTAAPLPAPIYRFRETHADASVCGSVCPPDKQDDTDMKSASSHICIEVEPGPTGGAAAFDFLEACPRKEAESEAAGN
ncbi:unnamed protein product [Pleuronectes platessa]|uniref:Uncharacterized protein n=1 Tax=Pleuronectes platessa TaxID=8262 RepID=A0A9N7YZU9_PLEPL|nr:unnamed protein product [Pleuronectes platessa]